VRPSCSLCRDDPQEHAAVLLGRAHLLSCICTRKMVPLLFRTSQPVMCLSVFAIICVHLLEPILHIHRFCAHAYLNMLRYLLFRTAGPAYVLSMRFICNHLTEQDRFPKPLAVVHIQEKLLLGLLFRRARPACVLSLRFIRDHFTEQRCRFHNLSSCLLCISTTSLTRNRCFVCCSGQRDLSRTVLSLKVHL
jgi:hypothetical protein